MKRTLILIGTAAMLASCATTSPPPGDPGPSATPPAIDRTVCPPAAVAQTLAEPLPPAGFSEHAVMEAMITAFGDDAALAFWRWWRVDYPRWAREGWTRLQDIGRACENLGTTASPPLPRPP